MGVLQLLAWVGLVALLEQVHGFTGAFPVRCHNCITAYNKFSPITYGTSKWTLKNSEEESEEEDPQEMMKKIRADINKAMQEQEDEEALLEKQLTKDYITRKFNDALAEETEKYQEKLKADMKKVFDADAFQAELVEDLKDFMRGVVSGEVPIFEFLDMDPKALAELGPQDLGQLFQDPKPGRGGKRKRMTVEAAAAKARFMETWDTVLKKATVASQDPKYSDMVKKDVAEILIGAMDNIKGSVKKPEEVSFLDECTQDAWNKFMTSALTNVDTSKGDEEIRKQLRAQNELDTGKWQAEVDKIFAENDDQIDDLIRQIESYKDDEDKGVTVEEKMKEPEKVVAQLEAIFEYSAGGSSPDQDQALNDLDRKILGKTLLVGADSTVGQIMAKRLAAVNGCELTTITLQEVTAMTKVRIEKLTKGMRTLVIAPSVTEKVGLNLLGKGKKLEYVEAPALEQLIAGCGSYLRRCVMLSELGTTRAGKGPFALGNLDGHLDRRRGAEQALQLKSQAMGFDYTIIRTGNLVEETPKKGLSLEYGDKLNGETSLNVAAEAVAQSLTRQDSARNCSMSLLSGDSGNPGIVRRKEWAEVFDREAVVPQKLWDDLFLKLDGPEVVRLEVEGSAPYASVRWVQDWALDTWGQPENLSRLGLSTPVKVLPSPTGARILFQPSSSSYAKFKTFKEEKSAEKAKEKREAFRKAMTSDQPKTSATKGPTYKKEGGLEIVYESEPSPRIRVVRCEYGPNVVVKELSEDRIISLLKKELDALDQ